MRLFLLVGAIMLVFASTAQAKIVVVGQDEASITQNANGLQERALLAFKDLGAKAIRLNMLQWRVNDPLAPFTVARYGMKPQLTLAGSMEYIRSTVELYRGVVHTYSIWNEPELGSWRCCFAPFIERRRRGSANSYRKIYIRAYRLIKKLDPGAKVIIGELSPWGMGKLRGNTRPWFSHVLKKKKPIKADGMAIHPYWWWWSPQDKVDVFFKQALLDWKSLMRKWKRERMLIRSKGKKPVPIYITEFGAQITGKYGGISEVLKAYKYVKQLKLTQFSQYMMFPGRQGGWDTSLATRKCRPTLAYKRLRKAITGAAKSKPVPWQSC